MPLLTLHRVPTPNYLTAVERTEEMKCLQDQARRRKSMLIFGPEGVGKTRLLKRFAKAEPVAIYVKEPTTPRVLMLGVLECLELVGEREFRLPVNPKTMSTPSLKGFVQRALDQRPFLLVIDHLAGPSRVVAGMIKELNYYGRTPVFFAARTPHMEDIGNLQPMCADRSERLEVKNFAPNIALDFAQREAGRAGLWAANLEQALNLLVEWSEGNPGSILAMLKMAHLPRYHMGDQIKAHILYLDYRMGRR
jgi:hypothetical protein